MHGHFSRVRFDEVDRFSAVVALQGRVSVEADHNEHTAILQHYLRTLVTDLLGRHAWPADNAGFEVALVLDGADVEDLTIGAGRCYVEGVLVENPAPARFYDQPDARFTPREHKLPDKYPYYVYGEVWERLVTFVEEPAIRDVALGAGGPDSSARTKVVWQARHGEQLTGANVPKTVATALKHWEAKVEPELLGEPAGTLTVHVAAGKEDELCALAPEAGYRGLENQLYRVEIHAGGALNDGAAGATVASFKWSRDNGSVVFPVTGGAKGKVVTVANLGRDDRYSLDLGDWVECVDDASVLNGQPLALLKVIHIDPVDLVVTLDAAPEREFGSDPKLHPLLRRWDQQPPTRADGAGNLVPGGAGNALEVAAGQIALEDGISVSFAGGNYRGGDYWVVPARVGAEFEWPRDDAGVPLSRPPNGVRRSYVPLALVTGPANGDVVDLRSKPFAP